MQVVVEVTVEPEEQAEEEMVINMEHHTLVPLIQAVELVEITVVLLEAQE